MMRKVTSFINVGIFLHLMVGSMSAVSGCPALQESQNGELIGVRDIYTPGQQVIYRCKAGFILDGSSGYTSLLVTCGSSGHWSEEVLPDCVRVCPPLDVPVDSRIAISYSSLSPYLVNTQAFYTCTDAAYSIAGENTRVCLEDGTWSQMQPVCLITCPAVDVPEASELYSSASILAGTTVEITCDRIDHQLASCSLLTCGGDGHWHPDPSSPICFSECDELPDVNNANLNSDGSTLVGGSPAVFTCDEEFVFDLPGYPVSVSFQCLSMDSGPVWQDVEHGGNIIPGDIPGECTQTCVALTDIAGATLIQPGTPVQGSTATYSCPAGFQLAIDSGFVQEVTFECCGGEWLGLNGVQLENIISEIGCTQTCPNLPACVPNAVLKDGADAGDGDTATYCCNPGTCVLVDGNLQSEYTLTCENGVWTQTDGVPAQQGCTVLDCTGSGEGPTRKKRSLGLDMFSADQALSAYARSPVLQDILDQMRLVLVEKSTSWSNCNSTCGYGYKSRTWSTFSRDLECRGLHCWSKSSVVDSKKCYAGMCPEMCPEGVQIVKDCPDLCLTVKCSNFPAAECRVQTCGQCSILFLLEGRVITDRCVLTVV